MGRYVRIVLTTISSSHWWRVGELEVYGLPDWYAFTSGAGLDNGSHTFSSFYLGTAGVQTVTIRDLNDPTLTDNLTTTVQAGLVDPNLSQISVTGPHRADGVDTATIAVTVTDVFGNKLPGKTVWIAVSGAGNVISGSPGSTDVNGVLTATLTSTQAEAKTVYGIIVDGTQRQLDGLEKIIQPLVLQDVRH